MPRILLGLLLFILASGTARAGIANGDFSGGGAHWWGPGIETGEIRTEAGRSMLRITGGYAAQDHIAVVGERRYRLSMSVRSQDAPEGSVFVQVSFRGEGVDPGWRGPLPVALGGGNEPAVVVTGGTRDWTTVSVVIEAPKGADQFLLYLRKKGNTPGYAEYTAITLEETTDPADTASSVQADALRGILLAGSAAQTDVATLAARDTLTSQEQPIASGGQAAIGIHVADQADIVTLGAAKTLAEYLNQITGATFTPLSSDAMAQDRPLFVIGRESALALALVPEADFADLGPDGFLIRPVGDHIVIAGATPRGTMYGVNWFLDRKLGVRWLSPDVTHVPSVETLAVPRTEERQVPRFGWRAILSTEAENKPWRARNLLNGESHGPSFLPSPPEIDTWDRRWSSKGLFANFFELLPPGEHGRQHPDWYAGGQLAMMNKEMRAAMANAVIERLRGRADYRDVWFIVHDMDWGWDMDPDSQAFADAHGGHASAPRLDMMIEVADRVRQALPGARLAFNAYHWSFTPPEGMTVPDHLLVFPMTIQLDYSAPLNEGPNAELGASLQTWSEIAGTVLVWDHIANFIGFIQPTPNITNIGRSIQWLATMPSVMGYFAEGVWESKGAEFNTLRAWMIARLLWDPSLDVQALIDDFCLHYYGPQAGPLIARYIAFSEAAVARTGARLTEKVPVGTPLFDIEFVSGADAILAEAQAAAAGTPFDARVRNARLPLDYVVLSRRHELTAAAQAAGVDWSEDLEARSARFWATIEETGVKRSRQGERNLDWLRETLAIERRSPEDPAGIPGVKGEDWVDLQDQAVNLYAGSRLVADPKASDGGAILLDAKQGGWFAQLKLDALPKTGEWRLFASVRNRTEGPTVAAVEAGSYPPMDCAARLPLGVTAGDYSLLEIPGGPFVHDPSHERGVYLQSISGPSQAEILVDRIIAARADSDLDADLYDTGLVTGGCNRN